MPTHKDLEVWKQAIDFVTSIYEVTKNFPDEEKFGITSQIRRAAVSIPSNISEGAARNSDREFLHFLYIALGSAAEIETQLTISEKIKYCTFSESDLEQQLKQLISMLTGLIRKVKARLA